MRVAVLTVLFALTAAVAAARQDAERPAPGPRRAGVAASDLAEPALRQRLRTARLDMRQPPIVFDLSSDEGAAPRSPGAVSIGAGFADSVLGSDDDWSAGFFPIGISGRMGRVGQREVRGLIALGEDLIAHGDFGFVEGVACPGIARWDGTGWAPFAAEPPFTSPRFAAYAAYNGEILAGDWVSSADSTTCIYRWDGTRWAPFPWTLWAGDYTWVSRILASGGDLFAAGLFIEAGPGDTLPDLDTPFIARWNGALWERIESGLPWPSDRRTVVEIHDGALHAGRGSEDPGPDPVPVLARWDGSSWTVEDLMAGARITTIGSYEGRLAAAFRRAAEPDRAEVGTWDGDAWTFFGSGVKGRDARVWGLRAVGDRLFVDGDFDTAGIAPAAGIACWNGVAWDSLAPGLSRSFRFGPLAAYRDRLIAGGSFWRTGSGLSYVPSVAEWDGTSWRPVGAGIRGQFGQAIVADFEVYGGELIASGRFSEAGGVPAAGIARWNGRRWDALGEGLVFARYDPTIFEITLWDGRLVADGDLLAVSGEPSGSLALWDGFEWNAFTPAFDGYTSKIGVHGGFLLAGGRSRSFLAEDDQNYLFAFDGTRWCRLGSGLWAGNDGNWVFPSVTALASWQGSLFVGGNFGAAGGKPVHCFARWDGAAAPTPGPPLALEIAPNPARETASISWHQPGPGQVRASLFDVSGRRVATIFKGVEGGGPRSRLWNLWNDRTGSPLGSGVYIVRLETDERTMDAKMVILR